MNTTLKLTHEEDTKVKNAIIAIADVLTDRKEKGVNMPAVSGNLRVKKRTYQVEFNLAVVPVLKKYNHKN